MSNETLSYLGYEDLSDFTSQHSDFGNLLVNKEGYIYKFQNFSWIDFILYSGSPNKSALLQLKTGEPLEIKLSVKEVHLINELGNNSKFYSIRILSDNFVNIAAKTDASITKQSPPKNAFNLDSLITEEASISVESKPETIPAVSKAPSATSDFVLNFPSSDSLKESAAPVKLNLSEEKDDSFILSMPSEEKKPSENEFKLNLSDSIFDTQEKKEEVKEEVQNISLDFTKEDATPTQKIEEVVPPTVNTIIQEEVQLDFLEPKKEIKDGVSPSMGFKLKHDEEPPMVKVEEKEEKITLNFLKQDLAQERIESTPVETFSLNIQEEDNLNFLQQTITQESTQREAPANKNQIIAQIQNDLKEIDEAEEETKIEESKEFSFTKSQKEEKENDSDINAYLFNKNEVKKEKKSFTKTLQSLFANSSDSVPQENKEDECIEVFKKPEAVLKQEKPTLMQEAPTFIIEKKETHRFPALSSLGLDKEEEDDLISEFVHDTKENIKLFKDFYRSGNIDQAEYTLIKMQSSANILNLNDIIITLANVKQSCTNNDSEGIEQLTDTLETQVKTLESYLESETV